MKNNIHILIVEDEALTAKAIEKQLKKMDYKNIDIAINYHKAMSKIRNNRPDLILLDVNLQDRYTGIDIAKKNEILNRIPIIYITMYKDIKTMKKMLETNAKYYLSKPFRYEELAFAISLVLSHKEEIVNMGYSFSYNLENGTLLKNNQSIKLSKNEKLLLETLIIHKGELVSFEMLEFAIWGEIYRTESSLRTLISSLRKKLKHEMIINISSLGYRLPLPKDEI